MSDKEFGGANEDLSLPKATVQKIITEVLAQLSPPSANTKSPSDQDKESHQTMTKPARELLITCALEFLRMLSSEANEISEQESKKTISMEHIEKALTELGFNEYIPGCREVVEEWKETQKKRVDRGEKMKAFGGAKDLGEEELLRMQQELLGQAGRA
ncbi:Negative cofactor 2 complex subunit beta [Cyphellophora attinorum]|uniref:Negative cofactor 2 complex subunit beta n=1 Tax=Cyphellophora attinorum TaxID=1664694 RepID=A0A0N1P1N2_9EURO|nr:Negative cofactor 2 complex subunit beta [Phialophora attinorum]KPI43915.1 Negative cofactor 2 complex subunit beta [Phialophora attinorum]